MAIYRGTGGAGDATNDVTVNEVTEKALAASNSAAAAANSATAAATSASNAATSETNVATSATNADNSATASANSATASANSATASAGSATSSAASESAASTSETNAATSESNAGTSETNAANSATASANSATASANSATASSTSETNAATSESNAATSETNAATSETNAATSATTASTQASNAASSATAASSSATSASNSAAAASVSATAAQTAQTAAETAQANAETAETNAETAETNAETAETNAAASASAASTSETNAATSASTATTQATNASTSASAASASASAASTSETNAAASAASAAALLDNFDDRYLGAKSADPTVDNDGDPLVVGALYYNSTASEMRVYTALGWVAASSATVETMDKYMFTATAGQTVFSGSDDNSNTLALTVGVELVFLNGVKLEQITDYSRTATSVTLTSAASASDELNVIAFGNFTVADTVSKANGGAFQAPITVAGTVTADGVNLGDNEKLQLGAGNDLQIYHTGAHSVIQDAGSGNLYIKATDLRVQSASNETYMEANQDGTVSLFYDNVAKIATSSTGVNVTGAVTATSFSGDGSSLTGIPTPTLSSLGIANHDDITVDGSGNLAFNSGYGSVATAYGCRAWVNFNGTGTFSIRAGGNVSSITDRGTGHFRVNFSTAMPDANYAASIMQRAYTTGNGIPVTHMTSSAAPATTNYEFDISDANSYGAGRDQSYIFVSFFR